MSKTPIKANRKYNSTNFNQITSSEHQDLQNYRLCNEPQEKQQETHYPLIPLKNSSQNLLSSINGGYKENNAQIGYGIQAAKYASSNKTGGNSVLAESSKMIFSQKPQNKKSSNSLQDESTNEEMVNSSAGFHGKGKKYEDLNTKQKPVNGDIPSTTSSLLNLFNRFNSGNPQPTGKEMQEQAKKIDINIYANSPFIIRTNNNKGTKEEKHVEDFYLNSPIKSIKDAQIKISSDKPVENDDQKRSNDNTETKKVS